VVNWEATYRVTTPMFAGGAKPESNAELRPTSIKGLLRFWFRAAALPQLESWQAVQKAESELFGSTEGQAGFYLAVVNRQGLNQEQAEHNWRRWPGIVYLGYGVIDHRGGVLRPYIKQRGTFTLQLVLKKKVKPEYRALLSSALKAFGFFGALGARSRKGFGSLSLESLRIDGEETCKLPRNSSELRDQMRELLAEINLDRDGSSMPEYTAFSPLVKVFIARTGRDPLQLLDETGRELLRYRSYGHKGINMDIHTLPWGEGAEQNFAGDHDLILDFIRGRLQKPRAHPRRVVFGLPHNYFFLSAGQKADIEAENHKRRASPLFIHIHALATGEYAAVLSLLPAVFLPEGERVKISDGGPHVLVDCRVNYKDIEDFFTRPSFQNKVVVWP